MSSKKSWLVFIAGAERTPFDGHWVFRSRLRYCIASAICCSRIALLPSRSAMVRAEKPRRSVTSFSGTGGANLYELLSSYQPIENKLGYIVLYMLATFAFQGTLPNDSHSPA